MNSELKKELLKFDYLPLVNDIFENIENKQEYQELYNENKIQLEEDRIHNAKMKTRLIKTKIMIVTSMILNFINNIFIRLCGYMIIGFVIGIFHSVISASSFLALCQYGQGIYDTLLNPLFHLSSQDLIALGAQGMTNSSVNPMSQSTSYIIFYTLFIVCLLFVGWVVVFIIKMKKSNDTVDTKYNLNLEDSYRILGCHIYDNFSHIKKKLEKLYLKNQIHRTKQLKLIKAYLFIYENKEFISDVSLDKKENEKMVIQLVIKSILYILNLISKGIFIGGIFVLIHFRFISFFVEKGYLARMWSCFVSTHEIVQGGILSLMPMYNEASLNIQIVLSVAFLIVLICIAIQFYTLVYKRIDLFKCRYKNYIYATRGQENFNKFQDNYSIHWFILMCIIGVFIVIAFILQ